MTPHMRYGLIGVIIGLILLWIVGPVVGIIVIAAAIAIPVIAYRMLTPEQRRRLRRVRRKQIGS
jgi:O-antigen/teichoic acid export membrane protein